MPTLQEHTRLEWIPSLGAVAGGIALVASGLGYGLEHAPGVGAGFMPFVAGVILVLTGGLWTTRLTLARQGRTSRTAAEAHPLTDTALELVIADGVDEEDDDVQLPDRRGWIRVGIIVAALTAAALLLPSLGYTASVTLLLFVVLRFVSERSTWLAALIAIGGALATRLVFQVWLGTSLPSSNLAPLEWLGL